MGSDPLRILVLSTFDGTNANVIRDYLFAFRAHSRHQYYYVFDCRTLDENTVFGAFDVILVFWSLHDAVSDLSAAVRERIRTSRAVKVMFLQDEYRAVEAMNHVMVGLGVNVVFTCVDDKDHARFYPPARIPSLEATYSVLTGYVPDYLSRRAPDLDAARPFDLTYRSRDVPFYLGDLAQHKRILAQTFPPLAAAHGLAYDISIREHDRLYGRRWTRFLRSSRCVLGSPSGSSVVDFTGRIRRSCEHHLAIHPGAAYAEVKARFFADVDGKVVIDTVSPRIFEAASLGATLVHVEGGYNGMLVPDVHYVRIAADYSNLADVVDRIKDGPFCRALAARAWQDLITAGTYSYRSFGQRFDTLLARHVPGRRRTRDVSTTRFYTSAYLRRRQALVPFRAGFAILPSPRLLFGWASRAFSALSAPAVRLPAQLIDNPGELVLRAVHALCVLRETPSLGAVLQAYRRDADARHNWGLYDVINELVKMDIASRARKGALRVDDAFDLEVTYDRDERVVLLTSLPARGRRAQTAPLAPDLVAALRAGVVRAMIWDHAAVGIQVVCRVGMMGAGLPAPSRCGTDGGETVHTRPGGRNRLPIRIGMGGIFGFAALADLGRRAPQVVGAALVELLEGQPPPSSQPVFRGHAASREEPAGP